MLACENAAIASSGEAIVSAEELMIEMSFVGLSACSAILALDDAAGIYVRSSGDEQTVEMQGKGFRGSHFRRSPKLSPSLLSTMGAYKYLEGKQSNCGV